MCDCNDAVFARADLHEFKGNTKRQAREMRDMLRLAQSALQSGRDEVAMQRIEAVLRVLGTQLGS